MALKHCVYIFRGKGMDHKKNRAEIVSEELRFIAIAVPVGNVSYSLADIGKLLNLLKDQ